jgi:hypothetical protein
VTLRQGLQTCTWSQNENHSYKDTTDLWLTLQKHIIIFVDTCIILICNDEKEPFFNSLHLSYAASCGYYGELLSLPDSNYKSRSGYQLSKKGGLVLLLGTDQ